MLELFIIIGIFSIVQSLFGVGLLLFGTPTLLLLDYSYSETLWILLPCSITISLIQSISNYDLIQEKKKVFYLVIPPMTISLALIVIYDYVVDISKVVGFFLLIIGLVNFFPKLQLYLQIIIKKQIKLYYFLIGFIHGISNMGGGPLSILMSTIYNDKVKIRANIAFIYSALSAFQLIVLFIINPSGLKYLSIKLMAVSLLVYMVINKFISSKVNDKRYKILINIVILIYGILVIIS
jgi:uncharacterized protein